MLYSLEISVTSKDHEAEWSAWHVNQLSVLLTVPGIETAQRFRDNIRPGSHYVALFSLKSPEVLESEAYHGIGGGGPASARFKDFLDRKRNIFSGIDRFPEVLPGMCVVISDTPPKLEIPNVVFTQLTSVGKHRSTDQRFLALVTKQDVNRFGLRDNDTLKIFEPNTERKLSGRPL